LKIKKQEKHTNYKFNYKSLKKIINFHFSQFSKIKEKEKVAQIDLDNKIII